MGDGVEAAGTGTGVVWVGRGIAASLRAACMGHGSSLEGEVEGSDGDIQAVDKQR
jgi:hypothetical protein